MEAIALSGFARSLLAIVASAQSAEYSGAVTAHAVLFIFLIVPLGMVFIPWLLQMPMQNKNAHVSRGIFPLLLGLVVVFVPALTVNSGWTFYQPLVNIVCHETSTNWVVAVVGIATVCFLVWVVGSIRDSSIGLASRAVVTLKIGHVFGLFVMPLLLVALGALLLDRMAGISVFDYPLGSPVIYETMFWVFGHPEVYLLILPFTGLLFFVRPLVVRSSSYTKSRRGMYGFGGSIVRIALVSFFVWGHHLFATSLTGVAKVFFILASLYIMIPMFDVVRRTFRSRRHPSRAGGFARSILFFGLTAVLGFFIGGILSLFFLSPHLSTSVHGTKWVVGHFHFFFVVFLFSAVAVAVMLLIGTQQTPSMAATTFFSKLVIITALLFFASTTASGLFGGLRRVIAAHGSTPMHTVFTNTTTVVIALLSLCVWLRLISGRAQPAQQC